MYSIKRLEEIVCDLEEIYDKICNQESDCAFYELNKHASEISAIFQEFINIIPKLNEMGMDIPIDVVIQQLNNLLEAMKYKDRVLLADTLRYEINDTLRLYIDIIMEMEKENISL